MALKLLYVFFISMVPIIELRGAIPFGILQDGLEWYWVFAVSVIGNMLPVPFVMMFMTPILEFMKRFKLFRVIIEWEERRIEKKSKKMTSVTEGALLLFVAIPFPGTGAWTGAMLASFLGLDRKKSFFVIFGGVLLAAIVVTLATTGVVTGIDWVKG